jgi:exopolyphosphatase / guanosine-5'-triphosphate,3'-diphosphate pyrophosphatase
MNPTDQQPHVPFYHSPEEDLDPRARYRQDATYAAIDLGTNNCRLLIAKPAWKNFVVIDAFSRLVRLGEGMTASGRLSDEAIERTVEALKVCADKISEKGVTKGRYVATEACRQAVNGPEFLARVKEETGLELEVIGNRDEAYLAASGCIALSDPRASSVLLFDIGGGSTEIIWVGDRKYEQGRVVPEVKAWSSLPLGVVTLSEMFGGQHVTDEIFDAMVERTIDEIAKFPAAREIRASAQDMHLLGSSGTVTTIAAVHLGLTRYIRKRVDGIWLFPSQVDAVVDWLRDTGFEARGAHPCIGVERADLILAGCAILEAIRQLVPEARLRVADRGVREGVLTELMAKDGAWGDRGPSF